LCYFFPRERGFKCYGDVTPNDFLLGLNGWYILAAKEHAVDTRRVPVLLVFLLVLTSVALSSESRPDSGTAQGNIYNNDFFGFTYAFPKGWSALRQQSQTGIRLAPGAALYTLLFATASPSAGTISPSNSGIVVLA
jgi:hypothetical protein